MLLPWKNLKLTATEGVQVAVQFLINDDDGRGERNRFQARWHPAGDPRQTPLAYQTFRLADKSGSPIVFKRSQHRDRSGLYLAEPPLPFPVDLPPLGAEQEDAGYTAEWSCAVTADETAFVAEWAIPWKTLADAGLDRGNLMLNVYARGPLPLPPRLGYGFERLIVVPPALDRPRKWTVRLHFAELDDVEPGQRRFDVKLQGRVVLPDFDILAVAGRNRAVVKEFHGIVASRAIALELIPKSGLPAAKTAPLLCGVELQEETTP